MNKRDLKKIKWTINDIVHRMWRIESLGHVLQNAIEEENFLDKQDFGTLAVVLNETIYRSKRVLTRLDKYFMRLN